MMMLMGETFLSKNNSYLIRFLICGVVAGVFLGFCMVFEFQGHKNTVVRGFLLWWGF